MYSSSDFERLFIRYKAEAMPEGESIQAFCLKNKVPYNLFHKWYKDTRHQIVPVHVKGHPEADSNSPMEVSSSPKAEDKSDTASHAVRVMIDIRMTNGMRIQQRKREYDREMITDEERTRRRQGLPTLKAMINLRANLLQELKNDEGQKSCYMQETLNYLHKFWKEAFTYIKDGRYPISNNLAERAVRPFTTKRKNSLHFGSDEGAEIAAVYHCIISTVKLQGGSAWDYLGKFFTGIFNGCRDFLSPSPQNIDLAVCK